MHPLGAALVESQLSEFEKRVAQLREVAQYIVAELSKFECIAVPTWPDGTQPSWYALPLKLKRSADMRITRERFVEALQAEGAAEVDIPYTTRCLHRFDLFADDAEVPLTHAASARIGDPDGLRQAQLYESEIFKIPVFYGALRFDYANSYLEAFTKVGKVFLRWPAKM